MRRWPGCGSRGAAPGRSRTTRTGLPRTAPTTRASSSGCGRSPVGSEESHSPGRAFGRTLGSMAGQWVPRDHDELTAGWRLWLELGSSVWPRTDWDGSPDEAVRGLQELLHACDAVLAEYLAAGGAPD